jgi:hypothetical protein
MQKARRHPIKRAPTACRRTVSGSISLRCSGFFSPFPHGTGSLSVSQEYLALADGPARFRQDFTCPALLRIPLGYIFTCTGLSPSMAELSKSVPVPCASKFVVLQPHIAVTTLVWAIPRSLATTWGITFVFFPPGT